MLVRKNHLNGKHHQTSQKKPFLDFLDSLETTFFGMMSLSNPPVVTVEW